MNSTASTDRGHLFVVHGLLESLAHDAAIITTDDRGKIGRHWRAVASPSTGPLDMTQGWTPVRDRDGIVVAVSIAADYPHILERIDACLAWVRRTMVGKRRARGKTSLPMVALPVVGIGRGGFGDDRGAVLVELISHLSRSVRQHGVDVVLVTPNPAVYAAAQYARRHAPTPLPEHLEAESRRLALLARHGQMALFTGAGVSAPSGLPTWHKLLDDLAAKYEITDLVAGARGFSATDLAGLIERAASNRFQQEVARRFRGDFRPSLLHSMLAALGSREVITTNYDLLYERAVEATGRGITSIMPWESAVANDRWILKLHGDVDHFKQIVLTRHHMVRYDAASRPSASMLQSLLLTRHTLFVGVSMSDDNVIRLMHEVQEYRTTNESTVRGTFGTVLDVNGDDARRRLWEGQLDWIDLSSTGRGPGTRAVELFLDRVALHAARDSSWLLDERFAGLLTDEQDRALAEHVRRIYQELPHREGSTWQPLVSRLLELGVDPDRDGRSTEP